MTRYDRDLVELLVPTIWDRSYAWGIQRDDGPDIDMPGAPRGKKNDHNTLWAHLADIRRAWDWALLTKREAQAVVLCGGMGLTHREAGRVLGIDRSNVQRGFDRGIGRLVDYLNGTRIIEDEEEE